MPLVIGEGFWSLVFLILEIQTLVGDWWRWRGLRRWQRLRCWSRLSRWQRLRWLGRRRRLRWWRLARCRFRLRWCRLCRRLLRRNIPAQGQRAGQRTG